MPSSVVAYRNHRLSDPPVHFNESNFRRFAPSAIAAGWLAEPVPPALVLNLGSITFSEGSGFPAPDGIIHLFQNNGFMVFVCHSGEWFRYLTVRGTETFPDVYSITI
jgi:hypothetical protein